MNRITSPAFFNSSSASFNRSSNSPRNFDPASIPARSSITTRLFFSISGILPSTIFSASPSAIADLPTPGSPIKTGLFFVRRLNIWIIRSISSERPITGSSSPFFAASVRSRPNLSSFGVDDLEFSSPLTGAPCATASISCCIAAKSAPRSRSIRNPILSRSLIIASSICSVPIKFCPSCRENATLISMIFLVRGV